MICVKFQMQFAITPTHKIPNAIRECSCTANVCAGLLGCVSVCASNQPPQQGLAWRSGSQVSGMLSFPFVCILIIFLFRAFCVLLSSSILAFLYVHGSARELHLEFCVCGVIANCIWNLTQII